MMKMNTQTPNELSLDEMGRLQISSRTKWPAL